jgi:3-isopropylmalate/(R)-2-methylmalate dehydratase small subunit
LEEATVQELVQAVEEREGYTLSIDLDAQTITTPDGHVLSFAIDSFRKQTLLKGLDSIGWTLSHDDEISAYEVRRKQDAPWLFAVQR